MNLFIIATVIIQLFSTVSIGSIISPLPDQHALAAREFSLKNRYADTFVNNVFRDNILLTIKYAAGHKMDPKKIEWDSILKPAEEKIILKPGETFAFHDDVLPEYKGRVTKTTNAHFNLSDGFKSDGYLAGDGVCHLASILYWAAKDAGLEAYAPTRHDFANIPEVPREYGVSIYATPGEQSTDKAQNLYITNNREKDVTFAFNYDGSSLSVNVVEEK